MNEHTSNKSKAELTDEVLRELGRNILLLQRMELLLKSINSLSNVSGYIGEIKNKLKKQVETVQRKTMGQLVGQYLADIAPDQKVKPEITLETLKEPHLSISTNYIAANNELYEAEQKKFEKFVIERNDLVHHFLSTYDLQTVESCRAALKKLNTLTKEIRSENDNLFSVFKHLDKTRKMTLELIQSDFFQFQLSPLYNELLNATSKKSRDDGWTELNKTVCKINKESPEMLKEELKFYECKSLKSFMLRAEIFEFSTEETAKGGTRVLYKQICS